MRRPQIVPVDEAVKEQRASAFTRGAWMAGAAMLLLVVLVQPLRDTDVWWHLATGRWSTDADRRSFVSAYLQTYREMQGGASEQLGFSRLPAQRGYRDGITDGLQQRDRFGSFRVTATEKYQKADRGYSDSDGDLNDYKQAYRDAYCNGYQQAYYRETENIETANITGANEPE